MSNNTKAIISFVMVGISLVLGSVHFGSNQFTSTIWLVQAPIWFYSGLSWLK